MKTKLKIERGLKTSYVTLKDKIKAFREMTKDPLRFCEYYKKNGCAHVDGIGCPCEEMNKNK